MNRSQSRAQDVRVLDALDLPRTTKEIARKLYRETVEAWWADEMGYYEDGVLEWSEDGSMPAFGGFRLMAMAWGRENDLPYLNHAQVYNRLVKLEKQGLAQRLVLPEHSRTVLWFRPLSTTTEALP